MCVCECKTLPHPVDSPNSWVEIMKDETRWSRITSALFFASSAIDQRAPNVGVAAPTAHEHLCVECDLRFPSSRALKSHNRIKHKCRNPIMEFLDDSGICPACETNFQSRWRCFKHLADPRRQKCATKIRDGNDRRVSPSEMQKIDEEHRRCVKEARKEGHSQPIASIAARTSAGKLIGHVTR